MKRTFPIFFILLICIFSCKKDAPIRVDDTEYVGGENFTTFVRGENAFGVQGDKLTLEESSDFVFGNSLFRTNWVAAPSSVKSLDGLGPIFNARSCGSCHFKDGRAAPPDEFNVPKSGLLFRISTGNTLDKGPISHSIYGGQIQDKSLPELPAEAQVTTIYEIIKGTYADGTPYTLQKPKYTIENKNYGHLSDDIQLSPRIAPQMIGLGLLENIPESELLKYADVNDDDGDGISGKPNYVHDAHTNTLAIGRYGWKANVPTIDQQNAGAFNGDMGLTTHLFPDDERTKAQRLMMPELPDGGSPEISKEQLAAVTLYVHGISVPARRHVDNDQYYRGKSIFNDLGCAKCHVPSYTTGNSSLIPTLNNQKIFPYTDLLLHDMGQGLADDRPDFRATGREWKTPPLWGIGLIPAVNRHTRLLHDGRARGVAEAILWHGGEAEEAQQGFKKLTKEQREDLLFFVKSL